MFEACDAPFVVVALITPARSVEADVVAGRANGRVLLVEGRGCVLPTGGALLEGPPTGGRDADLTDVDGPMDSRALVLSRDLVLESEVRAVVAGVPVRGVDAFELAEEIVVFVGDFVGD